MQELHIPHRKDMPEILKDIQQGLGQVMRILEEKR
jgi:hypothetical protein